MRLGEDGATEVGRSASQIGTAPGFGQGTATVPSPPYAGHTGQPGHQFQKVPHREQVERISRSAVHGVRSVHGSAVGGAAVAPYAESFLRSARPAEPEARRTPKKDNAPTEAVVGARTEFWRTLRASGRLALCGGTVIPTGERRSRQLLGAVRADRIRSECVARFVESSAARAAHQHDTVIVGGVIHYPSSSTCPGHLWSFPPRENPRPRGRRR